MTSSQLSPPASSQHTSRRISTVSQYPTRPLMVIDGGGHIWAYSGFPMTEEAVQDLISEALQRPDMQHVLREDTVVSGSQNLPVSAPTSDRYDVYDSDYDTGFSYQDAMFADATSKDESTYKGTGITDHKNLPNQAIGLEEEHYFQYQDENNVLLDSHASEFASVSRHYTAPGFPPTLKEHSTPVTSIHTSSKYEIHENEDNRERLPSSAFFGRPKKTSRASPVIGLEIFDHCQDVNSTNPRAQQIIQNGPPIKRQRL
ncbi:hypothetical protein EDC01DRAFT_634138 [Geopyxis carbonaria]|nr:hypothetical protein EDC01DRAFT_634138 [Geopyxis carbonaria]